MKFQCSFCDKEVEHQTPPHKPTNWAVLKLWGEVKTACDSCRYQFDGGECGTMRDHPSDISPYMLEVLKNRGMLKM